MADFPDCFPDNFETEILPSNAEFIRLNVFRILKYGVLNREAFISSFEENPHRFKNRGKDKANTYSTSCFEDIDAAINLLEMTFRSKHPQASIAEGVTEPECGPVERSNNPKSSHVDWWIYKDAHPEKFFKEVQIK